jgi:hypothetical protein
MYVYYCLHVYYDVRYEYMKGFLFKECVMVAIAHDDVCNTSSK